MRCKGCDYPLWNLKARQCPECGLPFRPDEFAFRPGAVRFCCPHCNQSYYGTDAKGHLVPAAFHCVTCGRHVVMNEMVLLPAEGLDEGQTRAAENPWLARRREGWWRSWFRTVGHALVSPGRLMRGTPPESSMKHAWWYFTATLMLVLAVAFIPATVISMVMSAIVMASAGPSAGAPPPVFLTGMMGLTMASMYVFMVPVIMVFVLLWGLFTHGVLKMGGGGIATIRRTYQALCYSTGAYATSVAPCLGGYVGPVWWIVSAILMIKEGHKVSGFRATIAVLVFPVGSVLLFVGLYILLIVFMVAAASTGAAASRPGMAAQSTQVLLDGVLDHAAAHNGRGPGHALYLLDARSVTEWSFVDATTLTDMSDVPVAGAGSLLDLAVAPPDEKQEYYADARRALPDDVVAHRVGDFVFTYHGMNLNRAAPRLWVVVMAPDPDVNPAHGPIIVGTVDGQVQPVPAARVGEALTRQNVLRAGQGLPPIPDPREVTHDDPATGGP